MGGSNKVVKKTSWISWFCRLPGNDFFCKVDKNYIQDEFNLIGLEKLPHLEQLVDLILDVPTGDEPTEFVKEAAKRLYGQIHARYILTNSGIQKMLKKYNSGGFGQCPRFHCESQAVLPIGLSDILGEAKVKLYCPKCKDVYIPNSSRHQKVDGSYFGTGFPHILFMVHPEAWPAEPTNQFVPRLYGFKIHPSANHLQ